MNDTITAMTGEETRTILDEITERIEKLSAASYGIGSTDHGKVVWPPNEEMSHQDALVTVFDLEDCSLDFSFANDDEETGELCVIFNNTQSYPESPGVYAREPLRKMLEREYALYVEEDTQDSQSGRLFARLIKAFEEPL